MKKLLLSIILLTHSALKCAPAICTVPIANLFHPSLQEQYPETLPEEIEYLYEHFPMGVLNQRDCLRIHQLLFHETVQILEERGPEVCIQISNVFYHNRPWTRKETTYWTLKKYIQPITEINYAQFLPTPLNYQHISSFTGRKENTFFTLTKPFYDEETDSLYSVRTRFLLSDQTEDTVTIFRYHPTRNAVLEITIDKQYGVINKKLSQKETINAIVDLLCEWTERDCRFPCIRGGCSGREYITPSSYQEGSCELPNKRVIGTFERDQCAAPYAGFDMPGLIMSACQIYHAPYCAKNTVTANRYLKPLDPEKDLLERGDIILVKGYAGVVADLENNEMIQARGHIFGDGTISKKPIHKIFKGITTYGQLMAQFREGKSVTLIDQNGSGFLNSHLNIIKLKSIFEKGIWNKPRNPF